VLLIAIFWDLSKPEQIIRKTESDLHSLNSHITTTDFDEDAEVQARIWNAFQLQRGPDGEHENQAFLVRSDLIIKHSGKVSSLITTSQTN
jgi:hypothetical protein